MLSTAALALTAALPLAYAQTVSNETVLGVYMYVPNTTGKPLNLI